MGKRLLYKYGSFEGERRNYLKEILLDSKIYFSNPFRFNDPFDLRPRVKRGSSREERQRAKEKIFKMLSKKFPFDPKSKRKREAARIYARIGGNNSLIDQFEVILKKYGVYCLSAKCDNLLMWAHYGAAHTGYCLEFDASGGSFFANASEVHYQADYPVIKLFHSDQDWGKEAVLTKSLDWAYEEEWRLTSTEYGHMKFPADELVGIILGCKTAAENVKAASAWIESRNLPMRIRRAVMNDRKYKLDLVVY